MLTGMALETQAIKGEGLLAACQEAEGSLEAELPDAVPGKAGVQGNRHLRMQRSTVNPASCTMICAPGGAQLLKSAVQAQCCVGYFKGQIAYRARAVLGPHDLRVAELEPIAALKRARVSALLRMLHALRGTFAQTGSAKSAYNITTT